MIECLVWGPCGGTQAVRSLSLSLSTLFSPQHARRGDHNLCEGLGLTMKLVLLGAAQHANIATMEYSACIAAPLHCNRWSARQHASTYGRTHRSQHMGPTILSIVASNGWSSMSAGFAAKGGGATVRSTHTNMVHGGHRNATARFRVLLIFIFKNKIRTTRYPSIRRYDVQGTKTITSSNARSV